MPNLMTDLRYALRMLAKNPGFTAVAVVTLALGIGANTAIFSFVDGVLLRPLPYAQPARLVQLWEKVTRDGKTDDTVVVAYPNFRDWRTRSRSFERMAAYSDWSFNLTGGAAPERVPSAVVSAEFFRVLGEKAIAGRTFAPGEDLPGRPAVAVIGRGLWSRRFGSDPRVIGRSIALDGKSFTLIGVVEGAIRLPSMDPRAEVFAPISNGMALENRRGHYLSVVARLTPHATIASARSEMAAIGGQLAAEYPKSNTNHGVWIVSTSEQLVGDVRPALLAMLAAVLLVLAIAAVNVANMMLARASSREREIAIRVALGAGRARIMRQLLTESVLLAVAGGAAGLALASWGVAIMKSIAPPDIPRLSEVGVDFRVAAFALIVSALTGMLFGFAPAWQISRQALASALKDRGSRGLDGRSTRLRNLLVVAEFSLSLMLVAGAGLMLKSFLRLERVGLGFDTARISTFSLDLTDAQYPQSSDLAAFQSRILDRLRATPGVDAAALVTSLPLTDERRANLSFLLEGTPADPANIMTAHFTEVSPGYFPLLRIPLLRGRAFGPGDVAGAPRVAVISDAMARKYFPGRDPIGTRITLRDEPKAEDWMTIVGVVAGVRDESPSQSPAPQMYMAAAQRPQNGFYALVRSQRDPSSLMADVRAEVAAIDRQQPISSVRTMDEIVSASLGQPRFRTILIGIFGAVALLLAGVGIYGVMAYSVSQRTQEIGIRMALGASRASILSLVAGRAAILVGAGLAVGTASSLALARALRGLLFEVPSTDAGAFAAGAALMVAVAAAASLLPARRASRVDPIVALREE